MLKGKISVDLVDRSAFFKGQKHTYLDFVLIETPDNKYGNSHMIVQDIGKVRRDNDEKGPIIGNVTDWQKNATPDIVRDRPAKDEMPDDDCPF